MGKKKNNNKKVTAGAEAATDAPAAENSSASLQEAPSTEDVTQAVEETTAEEDTPRASTTPLDSAQHDLAEQLEAARREIESLKEQLKAKDSVIVELQQQVSQQQGAPVQVTLAADTKRTEEMEKLRARLAALKQEQAEADSARENAWKQLKDVVAELGKLAVPVDTMPKTPTAVAAN